MVAFLPPLSQSRNFLHTYGQNFIFIVIQNSIKDLDSLFQTEIEDKVGYGRTGMGTLASSLEEFCYKEDR